MTIMKLFFVIVSFVVVITVACTAQKSAGSQPLTNSATNPASAATVTSDRQEQTPCALTQAAAPAMKGLKLGMTVAEVLALFPGSKDDADLRSNLLKPPSRFGTSGFLIIPSKYENKEKFTDISQITFTLLDGRVSNFTLGYNGPEWPHVDKFVEKVVAGTNLPAVDQWEAYVGMDTQLKTVKCTDLEIRVFAGGQGGNLNYVLLRDLEADKKLKERRDKARATPTPE